MVRREIFLILFCMGFARADTGYPSTVSVTESDNSPACTVGQLKFSNGTVTCSGQTATITNTGGGGGSGGYALQPATVTIQAAQGISISSTIVVSTPTAVITTTTTITSTMSYIEASCAFPNNLITLTLPPVFNSPGFNTFIYKVNATTCAIKIAPAGADTIEASTLPIHLDGQLQHASLHATNVGWGGGLGGIQMTPERLYPTPYQQARTFVVAASSNEVICPLIIPVPVIITGFAYDGLASGANLSVGIMDSLGNVLSSTGPVALATNLNVLTWTPLAVSAGSYNLAVQLTSTVGKIAGSDSSNSGIAGCSRVAEAGLTGIFSTALPGATPGSTPGMSVLVAGGRQTYQ